MALKTMMNNFYCRLLALIQTLQLSVPLLKLVVLAFCYKNSLMGWVLQILYELVFLIIFPMKNFSGSQIQINIVPRLLDGMFFTTCAPSLRLVSLYPRSARSGHRD